MKKTQNKSQKTKTYYRIKGIKTQTILAREDLRLWLTKHTKCEIQGGYINQKKEENNGWPCGTCVMALLTRIGLDAKKEEYHNKNKEHDRHNEIWRAILQIRDTKI